MAAPLFHGTIVSIHVTDLAQARAFYGGTLGLQETVFTPAMGYAQYVLPGPVALGVHETFEGHTGRAPGTVSGIVLQTPDVPGAVRELRRRGVRITDEAEKFDWGTIASFADPDGNEFMLMTP